MTAPRHLRWIALFALLATGLGLRGQDAVVTVATDVETRDPPTLAKLKEIEALSAQVGWYSLVAPLRDAAIRAYGQGRYIAADAWFHLYDWAAVFATPEGRFTASWKATVEADAVNYPGYDALVRDNGEAFMGVEMDAETQAWVLEHESFSRQFFTDLTQDDYLPNVLHIIEGLRRRDPEKFSRYASLALAIALVYDVQPPPYWPHAQVSASSLRRGLGNPAEIYEWLIHEDSMGHTLHSLSQLPAEELVFVVDTAAPVKELQWSVATVPSNIERLEEVYFKVTYRKDRYMNASLMTWNSGPYTLQAILEQGGICVDQAYFATEVAKARGVPTLLFAGEGHDGRHAWFGYLDGMRRWQLDAGRYAEQKLVTGEALDPQTWKPISDHQLRYISERFRLLPSYDQSRVQLEFAQDFARTGDLDGAIAASRKAVSYERRNLDAWELLLSATRASKASPAAVEALLRQASQAFAQNYPELALYYENQVCESLRRRGQTSLADYEERAIADRLKGSRIDLAIHEAALFLARSIAKDPPQAQIATYNSILAQYGQGSGTAFYDQVVVGFVQHLSSLHMNAEARVALDRARAAMGVQPGSQVAREMDQLYLKLSD